MPGFLTSVHATLTMFFPGLLTQSVGFLTGEGATGLDMQLVTDIMEMVVMVVTSFVGLLKLWPLNLFLILGIIGFCVKFFFIGKKGAKVG